MLQCVVSQHVAVVAVIISFPLAHANRAAKWLSAVEKVSKNRNSVALHTGNPLNLTPQGRRSCVTISRAIDRKSTVVARLRYKLAELLPRLLTLIKYYSVISVGNCISKDRC